MKKGIIIGVVAIILVAGGIYWFIQSQNNTNNTPLYQTTDNSSQSPTTPTTTNSSQTTTIPNSPTTQVPIPVTHNVTIQNFSFNPSSITIKKGDTIVWTNKDSMAHTITGNNGGPASSPISANSTYSFMFNNIGAFPYHCSIHPSMTGTVTVTQ